MIAHNINNNDLKLYEFDLTSEFDFDLLLEEATKFRLNFKSTNKHNRIHNVYLSDWFIQNQTNAFDPVVKSIEDKINLITKNISPLNEITINYRVLESWLLFYNKLGYSDSHQHVHYGWSSVCYISAEKTSSIFFNNFEYVPSTGKLLLFPGILSHRVSAVLPSHSNRVVFSTNIYPFIDYSKFISKNVKEKSL